MTKFEAWKAIAKGLSMEDRELLAKACIAALWEDGPQRKVYAANRAHRAIEEAFKSPDGE